MTTEGLTVHQKPTAELQLHALQGRRTIFEANTRLWMAAFLIATDLASLTLAVFLASQIRRSSGLLLTPYYTEFFGLLAVTLLVMFARKGLYPGVGLNYVDEIRHVATSTSFAFMVMLGITFVLKTTANYSRLLLLVSWLLGLVLLPAGRYFVRGLLIRLRLWGEPVVIIGSSGDVQRLAEHFRIHLHLGLRPVAVLWDDECATCSLSPHTAEAICWIRSQARGLSLQTALVGIRDLNEIDLLVERFRTVFPRVILIKEKNGRYGLNGLESLDFSKVLGLQVMNNLLNPWSQAVKRWLDVLACFLGMAILAPALGLIAVCIKLDSPGGVFYRQVRLGRNGRAFTLLKFRTMHQDADQVLVEELSCNPALQKEWERYQKLRRDPRITRVGRLLRTFSLDELPQLWNIARAEMSLVGPRPILPLQRDLYGEAFGSYIQVTPGMTGLWQVSGRNQTTFARRAELDNEYIQRWSIWLDIYILLKTIKVVFWQKGAY